MVLNNFKQFIMNPTKSITLKKYDGSTSSLSVSDAIAYTSNYALKVGTGTTAPTATDYKLESMNSSLTALSTSAIIGGNSNTDKYNRFATVSTTYDNATDSAITITEIGIMCANVLITREILATPVTIEAGESYTFTAVIDMK